MNDVKYVLTKGLWGGKDQKHRPSCPVKVKERKVVSQNMASLFQA